MKQNKQKTNKRKRTDTTQINAYNLSHKARFHMEISTWPMLLLLLLLIRVLTLFLSVIKFQNFASQYVNASLCFPGVCKTYRTSLQFPTAIIRLWSAIYDFRGELFILLTHSHTKSANNVCMAGSGDVVLGATLMLGVTGTECKIGILASVEV